VTAAPTSVEEIGAALDENRRAPYGTARSLRAERLADLAAQTGNRPLIVVALQDLIDSREFDGRSDEILVPFARVLRMWDEDASDFDRWATHRLHWHFKWVSSSVLSHPGIALSSIERWREEMADRYRQAGFGMHAVYARHHYLAAHLGDDAAAQRWYDDWLTADRDEMSDCHACDRNGQGEWLLMCGRDAEALETWAPVLGGQLRCTEEPHRVLAKSLLPLVRLGRVGEARDNHLRGYRMVRGNANLRRAVGEHIEFAALTGNEARGLEMLAEHAAWLSADEEDAATRHGFLEAVAVLLGRLRELGYADLAVPTPRGTTPTTPVGELLPAVLAEIEELTGKFDARNGTGAVGERSRARLAQRPLLDALPLGVRAAPLARPARPAPVPAAGSLDDLVAAAEGLDEARHPDRHAAWERVAATGAQLPPRVTARIARSRALSPEVGWVRARPLLLDAAARFTEAGEPGPAAACRARAGLAAVLTGDAETGWAELDEVVAGLDGLADRDTVVVGLCRARAAWHRSLTDRSPDSLTHQAMHDEIAAAVTAAERLGEAYPLASLDLLRAQAAHRAGDDDAARSFLDRAVDGFRRAGTPWEAAYPLSLLAELALTRDGDPAAAERYARTALDEAGGPVVPHVRASLYRLRAQAEWLLGERDADVVDHALAAAHQLDATAPGEAVHARLLAARAFHRQRRYVQATALLETVLPELADPDDLVQARRLAAACLREQGEPLAAAQLLLAAASVAADWPDQTAHAMLAHDAASALQSAGHAAEAEQAFARAGELWRALGQPGSAVRTTRARAWLLADRDEPDWVGALALFDAAGAELAAAEPADPADRWEAPETLRQAASLIMQWAGDADPPEETVRRGLALAEEAADGFAALGDVGYAARARLLAAEFEVALDRRPAALQRVRALRAEVAGRDDAALVAQCDRYLAWLER
jgi:tetratricopeptide (TPR) repeat protein